MNLEAICHRTLADMCYPQDADTLTIRLSTGTDITAVYLHFDDPMNAEMFGHPWEWKGSRIPIPERRATRSRFWWSVSVLPPYKRCAYFFELHAVNEVLYLFEDRFYKPEELVLKGRKLQCFIFPWINPSDVPAVPGWVSDTCWYQIFPDRFCRGNASLPKPVLADWQKQEVSYDDYYGGDLPGITKKLPYLSELGITGIYLTPVFLAGTSHKYDTLDYYQVDPAFGSTADLKELVVKAHDLGIRVILDGVFNHCGHLFPQWQDVLEKGPESEFYDWFMINQWPFDKTDPWTRDKKFYSFHFTAFMPKLNTNNPVLADYLIRSCEHWITQCGIDGIRLDVANEVSHSFLKELRRRTRLLRPDFFLLGEIWHDSMMWLLGDELDSAMDYPFRDALLSYFTNPGSTAQELIHDLNHILYRYPKRNRMTMFHMLGSHDTERLFTLLEQDAAAYAQALVLLYTLPGTPCIYYGDEIPLSGGADPDCRRPMPWDRAEAGQEIQTLIRALTGLRKAHPALTEGEVYFPGDLPEIPLFAFSESQNVSRIFTFRRSVENDSLTVYVNSGAQAFPLPGAAVLLSCRIKGRELLPGGFCILET